MRRARLVAFAAAVLIAGCGGGSKNVPKPSASGPRPASPVTVRTADCNLWLALDHPGRLRLIAGMRSFFGGKVDKPGLRGQVVPTDRAYRLFDGYCRQGFARYFKLYRLYGNAAGFIPQG